MKTTNRHFNLRSTLLPYTVGNVCVRIRIIALTLISITLLQGACSQPSIQPDRPTSPQGLPSPTPLPATVAPSNVPQPTVTIQPSPSPTKEIEPTACSRSYFFEPTPPLCPASDPVKSAAAEQPFDGGVMIWFEETDSIYVFYHDQSWIRFDDTWDEEQITSDPDIVPPADRFQPIRGFGKVWRENDQVREQLGWAHGPELAFDSMAQPSVPIDGVEVYYLGTFNGQVFALTNHGLNEGDWVIAAS